MKNFYAVVPALGYPNILWKFGLHETYENAMKTIAFRTIHDYNWDTEEHEKATMFLQGNFQSEKYGEYIMNEQKLWIVVFWVDNTPDLYNEDEEIEWSEICKE